MKTTALQVVLSSMAFFFAIAGQAQVIVNKRQCFLKKTELIQLDTVSADFIYVQLHGRLLSLNITCSVDYGQKRKHGQRKSKIRQADGRKQKFNSEAGVVNYLAANGWNYLQYDTYAFVFKRREN